MSRIGRQLIKIPKGVKITVLENGKDTNLNSKSIQVVGPHGTLSYDILAGINVVVNDTDLKVDVESNSKELAARYGLTRSLINNMVTGVSSPFVKTLNLQGVGYRAQMQGNILKLSLGCSHDINLDIPSGLKINVENPTTIEISGIEKDVVGLFASQIRNIRPPEPYNGKGVLYLGENIRRKAGKVGK
jgi:large subunit ribosomal protein L6